MIRSFANARSQSGELPQIGSIVEPLLVLIKARMSSPSSAGHASLDNPAELETALLVRRFLHCEGVLGSEVLVSI